MLAVFGRRLSANSMKQILQNYRTGATELTEVPAPSAKRGQLLIRTHTTLVSAGTERMLVDFGKANLLSKARQQPDQVRMVLQKVKTDGVLPTLEAVRNKLDQPKALGYCNVGVVVEVGAGVSGFEPGDTVASNGPHAEMVSVPHHLCAKVPSGVGADAASFTVLGAIALQGMRLVAPTLGECVVVTGLGLVGLLTVQLLRAQGCRVLGIDFNSKRCELARKFGAETVDLSVGQDPLVYARTFSRDRGVDAVILTVATDSNDPVRQAAQMCRKRGRIVLVGITGLELSREEFFQKELTFQVSCSYGPGRYDPLYEDGGQDYPIGFVRWTEQRNFEAVLDMLAEHKLDPGPLITHRFAIDQAHQAYELLQSKTPSLGILLEYPTQSRATGPVVDARTIQFAERVALDGAPAVSFIGAGSYASQVLIPAFKKGGTRMRTVASNGGVSSSYAARKFGFEQATTDSDQIFSDDSTHIITIATRHDSHARLAERALKAGKHVFVEKPLAIDAASLEQLSATYSEAAGGGKGPILMVGFNRRFSAHVQKMKQLLSTVSEPRTFIYTVNAGALPSTHWTLDPRVGGGRIIGEGCHFIDLLRFLAGAPVSAVRAAAQRAADGGLKKDIVSFTLTFADGSIGTIHYFANGHKSFPKERLDVFSGGRVLSLDNFRRLTGHGWSGFNGMKTFRQDKGQDACAKAFIDAVREGRAAPIPYQELAEVTRVSFEVVDQLAGA